MPFVTVDVALRKHHVLWWYYDHISLPVSHFNAMLYPINTHRATPGHCSESANVATGMFVLHFFALSVLMIWSFIWACQNKWQVSHSMRIEGVVAGPIRSVCSGMHALAGQPIQPCQRRHFPIPARLPSFRSCSPRTSPRPTRAAQHGLQPCISAIQLRCSASLDLKPLLTTLKS